MANTDRLRSEALASDASKRRCPSTGSSSLALAVADALQSGPIAETTRTADLPQASARTLAAVRHQAIAIAEADFAGAVDARAGAARDGVRVYGRGVAVAVARPAVGHVRSRIRLAAGVARTAVREAARTRPRTASGRAAGSTVCRAALRIACAAVERIGLRVEAEAIAALLARRAGLALQKIAALDACPARTAELATRALRVVHTLDTLVPGRLAMRSGWADLAVALLLATERALALLVAVAPRRTRVRRCSNALDAALVETPRARRRLALGVRRAWTIFTRAHATVGDLEIPRMDTDVARLITDVVASARASLVRDVDVSNAARRDEPQHAE